MSKQYFHHSLFQPIKYYDEYLQVLELYWMVFFATQINTVKAKISTCPLFREFRDPGKFAKITGREYSNGNLVCCIIGSSASKNAKIKSTKIIS